MFRKLTRTLRILDEVLEVLVLKLFIGGIRRRPLRAALFAGLICGAWHAYHRAPEAVPVTAPARVAPVAASTTDEAQSMLDIDMALTDSADDSVDVEESINEPVDFDAVRTDIWTNSAVIRYGGQEFTVTPGQLVPNASHPHFVITSVGEHQVEAFDWSTKQVVRKLALCRSIFNGSNTSDILDI